MLAYGESPLIEECKPESGRPYVLASEIEFYQDYDWCLDPYLKVRDAIHRLCNEIDRLRRLPEDWRHGEVATNVFLLSCALLNVADEYLRGPTLRLPRRLAAMPLGHGARWAIEKMQSARRRGPCEQARQWREGFGVGLRVYLSSLLLRPESDLASLSNAADELVILARAPLPPAILGGYIGVTSAFRRLDLTHFDIVALGRSYVERFPDRSDPMLLLGLRTAGSYFAPLLEALLGSEGFKIVRSLTVQPDKGPGDREYQELQRCAREGYVALILDDPPYTFETILMSLEMARCAGFAQSKLRVISPTHPARRNWQAWLPADMVVTMLPEHWHKHQLLESPTVERTLAKYYEGRGFTDTRVIASRRADQFNERLARLTSDDRGTRLKRIYEVHLQTHRGNSEIRFVMTKSVGWGWLGYHAFLTAYRLTGLVPPLLGLRDGILYTEWISQPAVASAQKITRQDWIEASAKYVAARSHRLRFETSGTSGGRPLRHQDGLQLLEKVLCRAYGRILTDTLSRPRLQKRLSQLSCPVPALIDGRMDSSEWIIGEQGLLKTDHEHHGLGKAELNMTDPGYDLADTILSLELSLEEEERLIERYIALSGDTGVEQRLFMLKLLAGLWTMDTSQKHLFGQSHDSDRQREFHQRYLKAWNFLTVNAARYCGVRCRVRGAPQWRSPLVVLDIDGVLDRRLFGFPCTSVAGIEALSLLASHGLSVAVNTARSADEVKEYCRAYALAGGIAEHGSYLWDAVAQREQVLISREAMRQLEELKKHLQQLPGVFIDDRHRYSVRAFTYQDKTAPSNRGFIPAMVSSACSFSVGRGAPSALSTLTTNHLITTLGLDRLAFHHTTIDSTFVAKDIHKGTGLAALCKWVLGAETEVFAVGDSEPDLQMFRAATRSYAPANISCAREARLLGCHISRYRYQRGLLDIARTLIHPNGGKCEQCDKGAAMTGPASQDLFLDVLSAADQKPTTNLLRALCDVSAFRLFVR
jgi:hydroxymethylpyrimidine pyrophosphatase-like HAD family hydrolase